MSTPGMSPYPQYSGGPGYGQPPAPPKAPGSVTTAFLIFLLNVIVSIVSIVLVASSNIWDEAVQQADSQGVTVSVGAVKGTVIGIAVAFALLYLFFDLMMRAGRNWARIVLTVLAAFSILSAVSARASVTVNGTTYTSSSSTAFGWIGAVLAILAIVMMYVGASNTYFRDAKAARKYRG